VTATDTPTGTPTGTAPKATGFSRRNWAGLALAAGAATLFVGLVDPNEEGRYPLCPLKSMTGWDCPGCGGLRCVHALVSGDVRTAVDQNLLAAIAVPLVGLVLVFLAVAPESLRRRISWRPGRMLVWFVVLVALVFTVLRNTPWGGWLGSGISLS